MDCCETGQNCTSCIWGLWAKKHVRTKIMKLAKFYISVEFINFMPFVICIKCFKFDAIEWSRGNQAVNEKTKCCRSTGHKLLADTVSLSSTLEDGQIRDGPIRLRFSRVHVCLLHDADCITLTIDK